ncbi:MAG: DNA repair protein RecO [Candidatus Binatia bacterium]
MRLVSVTPAIVLRSRPFGESDKIVTFLSKEHGKVTGIAKGAKRSRRRFANTLELFSLVNLCFQERPHTSLVFIHACDWIRVFKDLTTNLQKIAHASYLLEMTDEFTREREENRALFEHLKQGLITIEEKGPSLSFLTIFEMRLLGLAGYQPVLDRCRRCRKKRAGVGSESQGGDFEVARSNPEAQWRFSPRDGGILCEACSDFRKESFPLSQETINALAWLQEQDPVPTLRLNLSLSALKEARFILPHFIQYQINKELKSAPFLETFSIA